MTNQIFLSYSHSDTKFMYQVKERLEKAGYQVWIDETGLTPGTKSWTSTIEDAIEKSDALVVLLSPDAKESEWVRAEIHYARVYNLRVIPLFIRGTEKESIPLELIGAQWIDIRADFEAGITEFLVHISIESNDAPQEISKPGRIAPHGPAIVEKDIPRRRTRDVKRPSTMSQAWWKKLKGVPTWFWAGLLGSTFILIFIFLGSRPEKITILGVELPIPESIQKLEPS